MPPIKDKKEETLIFSFRKKTFQKKIVAIGSLEHGIGLTTLCLALSNFLCNKLKKKTAYVELNTNNQIKSLSNDAGEVSFSYMGIVIFPHRTFTSLAEILHMDFDYFILDMGVLNSSSVKEFSKFEKQYLVCSLNKWKRKKTMEKLDTLLYKNQIPTKSITILSNCHKKESTLKVFSSVFPVFPFPFIFDPFQITPDMFTYFGKIVGQY